MSHTDEYETILYMDLPTKSQEVIDEFDEDAYVFFAKDVGPKGYLVHAVRTELLDLLEAQGGMGSGWIRVMFQEEQEDDFLSTL